MVEHIEKEFALLFKRIKKNDTVTEFVPCDVITGQFVPEDNWFMDDNEIVYPHIAEPMNSGVGYAGRVTETIPADEDIEKYIEYTKTELLNNASNYVYIRDISKDYQIAIISKEDYQAYVLEDADTESIYKQYEDAEENEINPENNHSKSETTEEIIINMSPLEIKDKVTQTIKGQDAAVQKIVTALWTTVKFSSIGLSKKNMLVIGPSGVGKTAIFRKLKEILDFPLSIYDVSGTSQSGYVGRSVDDILTQVYYDNDMDLDRAQKSIVILDEIDKIAYSENTTGDISTSAVQNELLKIIEGTERTVKISNDEEILIDTSNMIFVGTGAFEELYDTNEKRSIGFENNSGNSPKINKTKTLNSYGLKKQLLGRLSTVIELNPMTKDMLKDIILNSDESELMITLKAIESLGVTVTNTEELIELIINDAINRGIGATGLTATINNIFLNIFYEVANNKDKYKEVIINKNILNDNNDFILIPKKVKTKNLQNREVTK